MDSTVKTTVLNVVFVGEKIPAFAGRQPPEAVDMNGRIQMQGGKNWILPK
jgi:hypothetical protein